MTTKKDFQLSEIKFAEGGDPSGIDWVQIVRTGVYLHPKAPEGKFVISGITIQSLVSNYNNNVRRLDKGEVAFDFSHKDEEEASGWIQEVESRANSKELWGKVDWTVDGREKIEEKKFRFVSPEINFDYMDNESGVNHGPTLMGAGLTNRPHIKNMKAIFSEYNINQPQGVFSMTPEEMMSKIGNLEGRVTELEGQLKVKSDNFEEATKENTGLEKKFEEVAETNKQLSEKLVKIEGEKVTVQREAKFTELLGEGKILPAQKESFMQMELKLSEAFFKDAVKLNLSEKGHGQTPTGDGEGNEVVLTAADKIEEKALKLMEADKGLQLSDAYSQVMRDDKVLAAEYDNSAPEAKE
jgi:phage I-like protein